MAAAFPYELSVERLVTLSLWIKTESSVILAH